MELLKWRMTLTTCLLLTALSGCSGAKKNNKVPLNLSVSLPERVENFGLNPVGSFIPLQLSLRIEDPVNGIDLREDLTATGEISAEIMTSSTLKVTASYVVLGIPSGVTREQFCLKNSGPNLSDDSSGQTGQGGDTHSVFVSQVQQTVQIGPDGLQNGMSLQLPAFVEKPFQRLRLTAFSDSVNPARNASLEYVDPVSLKPIKDPCKPDSVTDRFSPSGHFEEGVPNYGSDGQLSFHLVVGGVKKLFTVPVDGAVGRFVFLNHQTGRFNVFSDSENTSLNGIKLAASSVTQPDGKMQTSVVESTGMKDLEIYCRYEDQEGDYFNRCDGGGLYWRAPGSYFINTYAVGKVGFRSPTARLPITFAGCTDATCMPPPIGTTNPPPVGPGLYAKSVFLDNMCRINATGETIFNPMSTYLNSTVAFQNATTTAVSSSNSGFFAMPTLLNGMNFGFTWTVTGTDNFQFSTSRNIGVNYIPLPFNLLQNTPYAFIDQDTGAGREISFERNPGACVQCMGSRGSLAVGLNHSCSIGAGGQSNMGPLPPGVRCWGENSMGQLGNGTTTNVPGGGSTPVLNFPPLSRPVTLSAGDAHSCLLATDAPGGNLGNRVYCWGDNSNGQLGNASGGIQTSLTAAYVSFGMSGPVPVAIASGGKFNCSLMSDGRVKCWGDNQLGTLGDGGAVGSAGTGGAGLSPPSPSSTTPNDVKMDSSGSTPLSGVVAIATGRETVCALVRVMSPNLNDIYCWGSNQGGLLGNSLLSTPRSYAQRVGTTSGDYVSIAMKGQQACVLTRQGTAECWGSNTYNQLGTDPASTPAAGTQVLTPTPVVGLDGVAGIALGERHTCAVLRNGQTKCWGDSAMGQTGSGSLSVVPHPTLVNSGSTGAGGLHGGVVAIAAGNDHTCTLRGDGQIQCWGSAASGVLGNGILSSSETRYPDVPVLNETKTARAMFEKQMCNSVTANLQP